MVNIISTLEDRHAISGPIFQMERRYSNSAVDKAGRIISVGDIEVFSEEQLQNALDIFHHWRAIHAYPLNAIAMTLKRRAAFLDRNAIVAQRLKRHRSIVNKLMSPEHHIGLSQMQDIAGCRAVLSTIDQVYALKRIYEDNAFRSLGKGSELVARWSKDYIMRPKPDGYRSIHLVMKYRTIKDSAKELTGLRVEIQIRSRLQHAWAMGLETASVKTNQALKSGRGLESWKKFFRLMATVIALKENMPVVSEDEELHVYREVKALSKLLKPIPLFEGMRHAIQSSAGQDTLGYDDLYLMELNSQSQTMKVTQFPPYLFARATAAYASAEMRTENNEDIHVVLVRAAGLRSLRLAYPSYFLDASDFIELIREACDMGQRGPRITDNSYWTLT